jgi:hypothetical protein
MDASAIISRHSDLPCEAENGTVSWRHPVVANTRQTCGDARLMTSDGDGSNVGWLRTKTVVDHRKTLQKMTESNLSPTKPAPSSRAANVP